MADILFHAHSGVRYLVLVAGAAALFYASAGWVRRGRFDRTGRRLGRVFVGLVDLQVLLGVVLLAAGDFYPALIGHIVMMVLAAAVAHGFAVAWQRRPPDRRAFALQAIGVAMTLVVIVGGILAIGRSVV